MHINNAHGSSSVAEHRSMLLQMAQSSTCSTRLLTRLLGPEPEPSLHEQQPTTTSGCLSPHASCFQHSSLHRANQRRLCPHARYAVSAAIAPSTPLVYFKLLHEFYCTCTAVRLLLPEFVSSYQVCCKHSYCTQHTTCISQGVAQALLLYILMFLTTCRRNLRGAPAITCLLLSAGQAVVHGSRKPRAVASCQICECQDCSQKAPTCRQQGRAGEQLQAFQQGLTYVRLQSVEIRLGCCQHGLHILARI